MQYDQDCKIGEHGFHLKGCRFHIVYHDRIFFCKSNANHTVCEKIMVFATE